MALSRRDFLATSALACGSSLFSTAQTRKPSSLTVDEIIDRIQRHVGVPWRTSTVDRIIFGAPDTPVRAIATTMMSTFDVCKRAQALGANFVITHEPTFYLHEDTTSDLWDNPVVRAKKDFLRANDMAIFRFHDHIHAMNPDGVARGMLDQLGWQSYVTAPDLHHFNFQGMRLAQLAQQIATKLHAQTIRVVGDPNLPIRGAVATWGAPGRDHDIAQLADPTVNLFICGEAREWETVEYVQDAITAGEKKALIVIGHVLSEQGGMIWATNWLKTFVPEVPITFVPASEPFWRPDQPPRTQVD